MVTQSEQNGSESNEERAESDGGVDTTGLSEIFDGEDHRSFNPTPEPETDGMVVVYENDALEGALGQYEESNGTSHVLALDDEGEPAVMSYTCRENSFDDDCVAACDVFDYIDFAEDDFGDPCAVEFQFKDRIRIGGGLYEVRIEPYI